MVLDRSGEGIDPVRVGRVVEIDSAAFATARGMKRARGHPFPFVARVTASRTKQTGVLQETSVVVVAKKVARASKTMPDYL